VASVPADQAKKVETVAAPVAVANSALAAKPVADVKAAVAVAPKAAAAVVVKPAPVVAAKPAPVKALVKAKASPVKTPVKAVAKKVVAPKIVTPKTKAVAAKPAVKAKGFNMTNTVKTFTAETSEKATEMFKDVTARAKTAFEKSSEVAKDVTAFNKDNLEAVVESGKIAVKGVQTAAQTAADFTRKNFEATTTMLKTAAAVKSPTELLKVQGDFAKSQFEAAVAEMSKSSEFTLKLMGEMFQPISNRYSVAAEMVKTRLAA
jgi:phasin family protein